MSYGPLLRRRKLETTIRIVLIITGLLLDLAGTVWILQGIGVLPGSFMTGQTEWAIYGAISVAAGMGLLLFALRRRA